jgi:hypothetical protein
MMRSVAARSNLRQPCYINFWFWKREVPVEYSKVWFLVNAFEAPNFIGYCWAEAAKEKRVMTTTAVSRR